MSVPGWQRAIQQGATGTRLLLEVTAGSREDRFPAGHNPWRGRIGIRVRAPAQKGQANEAVVALVASMLDLAPSQVTIVAGHLDPRKDLLVAGTDADTVRRLLAPHLEMP